jgi:hypothetical protein
VTGKRVASVSLDMDNLWSYLKTHGNPEWERLPSYLGVLAPRIVELFGEQGITASVFVVGLDASRDDGAKAVAALSAAGHEIANHSFKHEPWLHRYSRDQLVDELARTEEAISDAGAPVPVGFRGPGYSLSPELLDVLAERGYRYDATTLPTWIGPLARTYYFRASKLSAEERAKRSALFGSAWEGLRPIRPYEWRLAENRKRLVELPVTTMPLLRLPIHISYLIHLHQQSPRLARRYFALALDLCRLRGVSPSILLHPLDLLDHRDSPGLEFFPGMALPSDEKLAVLRYALAGLRERFDVVGTAQHVDRLRDSDLGSSRPSESAGPRQGGRLPGRKKAHGR